MTNLKRVLWYQLGLVQVGGGERLLLEGLKYFNEKGIDATLFTEACPVEEVALFNGLYQPKILQAGIKINDIFVQPKNFIQKFYHIFLVRRAILEYNPDMIIANNQWIALKLWCLSFLMIRKKIPYVCFIHGTFFQFSEEREKYACIFRKNFDLIHNSDAVYKELISIHPPASSFLSKVKLELGALMRYIAVRNAKSIFVLTNKAKREIELLYGHSNVLVFHGAFENKLLNSKIHYNKRAELGLDNMVVLLSLCRLVEKKKVDIIIKAFSLYIKKNANAVLLVGGTGPEKEYLEQLVINCNIVEKVRFLGYVPEEDIYDYYLSCDIFTSADNADYDITSIVALALGKSVVASSQHEFANTISSLNLLFQAEPNPESFANSFSNAVIACVVCDPQKKEAVMREYSWEYYFSNIIAAMDNALLKS